MDLIIPLLSQLGPWGLLGLCVVLGSSGIAALYLVLRHLPAREAAHEQHAAYLTAVFREELAQTRASHTLIVMELIDRVERKLDRLEPCRPLRLHTDPDPGDAA